nr:hypothetical protein HK105_007813 [Polyrhizophydium stewartii]
MFTFSVFADSLRKRFGFSSSDINIISGSGNTALYLSFLAIGPIYDVLGATATMAIAAVSYSLGYALIWAAYQGVMPGTSVGAVAVFYFIAGFGATAGYMAVIGINVINFPPKLTGLTTGVLLLFYGLSGTIYAQVIVRGHDLGIAESRALTISPRCVDLRRCLFKEHWRQHKRISAVPRYLGWPG